MISVIVPVYKVENHLSQCIESVLNQSFTDFELLLIDDGSPDRSGIICEEYATKDSRIRVFHKENGGASSARNLGLKNAKGDLIMFVDADDWIAKNAMEVISNYYIKYELDFLLFEVCSVEKNGYRYETNFIEYKVLLDRNGFVLNYKGGFSPCCGVYRRDIFVNNNLFFYEGIVKEDIELLPQYFYYSNRFLAIKDHLYFYNKLNDASVTSQRSLDSKRISILSDFVIVRRYIDFLETQKVEDTFYRNYIFDNMITSYLRLFFRGALTKSLILPNDVISIYDKFKADSQITFKGGRPMSRLFNVIANCRSMYVLCIYINYYLRSNRRVVKEFLFQNRLDLINEKNLHTRY